MYFFKFFLNTLPLCRLLLLPVAVFVLREGLWDGLCHPTATAGCVGAEILPAKSSVPSNTDGRYRLEKMQTLPGGGQAGLDFWAPPALRGAVMEDTI